MRQALIYQPVPHLAPQLRLHEMVVMWKPVRLQGVGAASSVIDANTHPSGNLLNDWRKRVVCLFGLGEDGRPSSWTPGCAVSNSVPWHDTYRLKLTFKNGQTQHIWVDAKTFLETKIEGTPRRLDGKYHTVEIYYRDYRSANGLMIPYVLETKVQGVRQTEKIVIEKVEVNPRVEDSRFAKLQ